MRITFLCSVFVCLSAVLQGASGRAATAQTSATLTPGTRIRVTAPGVLTPAEQSGRFLSLRSDSLLLQPDAGGSALVVPRSSVTELEVSTGRHTLTRRGLTIGLLVGAGVGAGLGAATYSPPRGCNNLGQCIGEGIADPGRGGLALICGVLGGVSGLVVGSLIGHAHMSDQWQRVNQPLASLFQFVPHHMSVAPLGNRVAVTLRI